LDIFPVSADKYPMNGLTLSEIANALGIEKWAAEKRLRKAGVEKLTRDALYPLDAIERIKNAPGRGRPRKPAPEPAKPAKKGKK
jgi:predicted ArsR family transcriptional regulator